MGGAVDVVCHGEHPADVRVEVGEAVVELLALEHGGFDAGDGDVVGLFFVVGVAVFDGDGSFALAATTGVGTGGDGW